jgi:hypothetical protein
MDGTIGQQKGSTAFAGVTPAVDYGEIKRRFASTKAPPQATAPITPGCSRAFKDDKQAHVLVNIAKPGGAPHSDNVAIRILGFFETKEDAFARGAQLEAEDPSCCIACLNAAEWYIMSHKTRSLLMIRNKLERLLAMHTQDRVDRHREFEAHRAAMRAGRKPSFVSEVLGLPDDRVDAVIPDKIEEEGHEEETRQQQQQQARTENSAVVVKEVPPSLQQSVRHAVIMVLEDRQDNGAEPGVCILGGFDTDMDARAYVEHVASKQVKDHDVAVVDMYKWLYLHLHTSDAIEQVERDAELDRIMRKRRARDNEVNSFKNMCTELNIAVPYKDVGPDVREDGTLAGPELTEESMLAATKSAMTVTGVADETHVQKPRWNERINPKPPAGGELDSASKSPHCSDFSMSHSRPVLPSPGGEEGGGAFEQKTPK